MLCVQVHKRGVQSRGSQGLSERKKTSKKKSLTTGFESQPRGLGTERLEEVFTTQQQQKKCLIEIPENLDVKSKPDDVRIHIQARPVSYTHLTLPTNREV